MSTSELLTLVHGATFCVSGRGGDIAPDGHEGLFHRDVRLVSRLLLLVDGRAPRLLSARRHGADRATWVYVLDADPHGSPTAVLVRRREVGERVVERLAVRVFHAGAQRREITLALDGDGADLLDVKAGRPSDRSPTRRADGLVRSLDLPGVGVRVRAEGTGVRATSDGYAWTGDDGVSCTLVMEPHSVRDTPAEGYAPSPAPPAGLALRTRSDRWSRSVASAVSDLRGLQVEVPSMNLRYVGAGAPWYMALFGRDTLLTAWESLPTGPRAALDVLAALASRQGRGYDARTGEQPGRILHELRTGLAGVFGVPPGTAYYGTVDATPLFVMLLGEVHRWGAGEEEVRALLPAARAAMAWCAADADVDGDGFVEYVPDDDGLVNQGWKDSADALVHADGTLAHGPIALAEVQGYVYAAAVALAALEERLGDPSRAPGLRADAERLRAAFVEAFVLPDGLALALDGDKRPLKVATSNIGHVLWSGILPSAAARGAARRLTRPDLAATWGLRTLASGEAAYNPLSYHLGSIWPHDTAIGIAGLVRTGELAAARRLTDGLLRVAERFDWRLPELLAGLDVDEVPDPVPYPVACSPQAWSAAAPLLLLRSMLRLDPDVPAGRVHVAPILPDDEELEIRDLPLGTDRLSLRARGEEVEVLDAPATLEVVTSPRAVP